MIECLAIIGSICLSTASGIAFSPGGLSNSATARVGRAEAEVTLGSDNYLYLDPRQMDRACSDGHCLRYHKACETDRRRWFTCAYSFADTLNHPAFRLSAPTRAVFAEAEASIFVLADPARLNSLVPLAALTVSGGRLPICRFEGPRVPICPPEVLRD